MGQISVERDINVEMRDKVTLATDVYRPADSRQYPTLVQRLPYNKSDAGTVGDLVFNPLSMAERGYAVVVQDTRGRFESNGKWNPFFDEAFDGYDTIEWAASQPWSNGRVGIYGSSYMGVTALQAAITEPPHLEAVLAYMTGCDYHDGWSYSSGAFELGFNFRWVLGFLHNHIERFGYSDEEAKKIEERLEYVVKNLGEAYWETPYYNHSAIPDQMAPYWKEWLDNPTYNDYWKEVDVSAHANCLSVPILHVGGWYDIFLKGHLDLYQAIKDSAPSQAAKHQKFIIGPWNHESYQSKTPSKVGDYVFGPEATSGAAFMSDIASDWFDHWLKEKQTGVEEWQPVEYFVTGENEWDSSPQWPPEFRSQTYYFHSTGDAAQDISNGELKTKSASDQPPDQYEYDPEDPVPTCGGRILMPNHISGGIKNQSEIEGRDDVLTYTSSTLQSPLKIAGPVDVELFVESTAPETDFTAKLVDVHPDGYCANICEGIVRTSSSRETDEQQSLESDSTSRLSIDLWSMAHIFKSNHRIRVEISSSNFPRYDRHPNTSLNPALATSDAMETAVQRVHHSSDTESCINLPVIR